MIEKELLPHERESAVLPQEKESAVVSSLKRAILTNLSSRYTDDMEYLLEYTALDPRFRTLSHLQEEEERTDVYRRLKEKAVQFYNQATQTTSDDAMETDGDVAGTSGRTPAAGPAVEEPPAKKTALEDLLGETFTDTEPPAARPIIEIEREMDTYNSEKCIPLTSCPLKWWKENKRQYPLLSPLAKAFLSIPATSVPSEGNTHCFPL